MAAGDAAGTVLVVMSLANINTAIAYLVGAIRDWPGFWFWAVCARGLMGAGLLALAIFGQAPGAFFAAAAWEWIGAGLIGGAVLWDRSR